jgi:putative NADH-flavin reductase
MKTIALFGASGKTGTHFLHQALAKGYTIKALVRNPKNISIQHKQLTIIQGDVLNPNDALKTVEGTEIVVSLFGHVKNSPEWLQTNGTQNIIRAIGNANIPIISLSGGGLPFEKDEPKFADKLIRLIMKVAVPKILNDAIKHAEVLKQSNLKWMIVRGPRLTDGDAKGTYRVGWVGVNGSTQIARADLAAFILSQVEKFEYNKQMPFVSY